MRVYTIFIILLIFLPLKAYANEDWENFSVAVYNNAAYEAIKCSSYYRILSASTQVSGDLELSKKAASISDNLLNWSIALTEKAGMLPETVYSRYSLISKSQMEMIDNSSANISILMEDNQECKSVAESPQDRLMYWLDKKTDSRN